MAWITVKLARAKLDNAVSLQTLYRIAHSGEVKTTRLRGRILIDADSLDVLLKKAGLLMIQQTRTEDAYAAALDVLNVRKRA